MEASLYYPLFLGCTSALAGVMAWTMYLSPGDKVCTANRSKNIWICVPLCIVLTIWLGMRPPFAKEFGDSFSYAHSYMLPYSLSLVEQSLSSEWLFTWIGYFCKIAGFSIQGYFTVLAALYLFPLIWALRIFVPRNPLLGFTFALCSLMFFTFSVNGLRNGAACHILLLAMAFFLRSRYIAAALLALVAFSIHRSVILPIAAMVAARWIVVKPLHAVYIWLGSIALSLLSGTAFISFFSSLGFDDRMESYAELAESGYLADSFSSTGFRWDFLLYSSMPIVLGYVVLVMKGVRENWYRVLFNTYCMANAFWVLVIRAAFTNRFAYLSWFMYPIVIAYPLIMMRVWPDQDRKTALILAAYAGFTLAMNVFYW